MTPGAYNEFVGCDTDHLAQRDAQTLGALGLAGESGEVVDVLKKHLFHHVDLSRSELVKELGDVAWYFFLLLRINGISFEEVLEQNVRKLCARYPDRYGVAGKWLTPPPKMDGATALGLAAQAWCTDENRCTIMDEKLAMAFAEILLKTVNPAD